MRDEAIYFETLKTYLAQAACQIESDLLVAEVNLRDHQRLGPRWEDFARAAAPDKTIRLSPDPIETLGGVRVTSADALIRADNTFEGRLERLRSRIEQVILERLLPSGFETGNVFSG